MNQVDTARCDLVCSAIARHNAEHDRNGVDGAADYVLEEVRATGRYVVTIGALMGTEADPWPQDRHFALLWKFDASGHIVSLHPWGTPSSGAAGALALDADFVADVEPVAQEARG